MPFLFRPLVVADQMVGSAAVNHEGSVGGIEDAGLVLVHGVLRRIHICEEMFIHVFELAHLLLQILRHVPRLFPCRFFSGLNVLLVLDVRWIWIKSSSLTTWLQCSSEPMLFGFVPTAL